MNKTAILLGVSAIAFGVLTSGAEARKVTYEINGKKYSYSTNNIAQTKQARERMAAAKAAEAARAKAEAERTGNPLTAAFGSQAQKEAKEAEDRLQQVLSGKAKLAEAALPAERRAEPRSKRQDSGPRMASAGPLPVSPAAIKEPVRPQPIPMMAAPAIAQPLDTQHRAKIKSVSFDVETGIKTTIKIDGTVEEEPFDSSMLTHLAPEQEKANSLTAFVNQLRKILPDETTGSIQTSGAVP